MDFYETGPNRRPLPVPTETPPKFKGESSSRNPQISRSIHPNIANAASAAAIEVKEELGMIDFSLLSFFLF